MRHIEALLGELRSRLPVGADAWMLAEIGSRATHLKHLAEWVKSTDARLEGTVVTRVGAPLLREERASRDRGVIGLFEVRLAGREPVWLRLDVISEPHRNELIAVAAFQRREDLDHILGELRAFARRHARERRFRIIGAEDEPPLPATSWDDVVLPPALRDEIREAVAAFVSGRERFARFGIPWRRGFLFVGPPGNGKTLVCKAIAATSGLPLLYVRVPASAVEDWLLDGTFREARELAPCVVCFEDVDALLKEGGLAQLLNHLDGFEDNAGLLVLATSNHPETLDPAILSRPSRFDRVWCFPEPERPLRRAFLGRLFAGLADPGALDEVADATEGFSMAFLQELKVAACLGASRDGRETLVEADLRAAVEMLARQIRLGSAPGAAGRALGFKPTG